jgi:hypothetical protein
LATNHIGIDRDFGFLRRYAITHPAARDGGQLGAVLDHDNAVGDVERRGLKPQFQRKKPRGRPMPAHIARAMPSP